VRAFVENGQLCCIYYQQSFKRAIIYVLLFIDLACSVERTTGQVFFET